MSANLAFSEFFRYRIAHKISSPAFSASFFSSSRLLVFSQKIKSSIVQWEDNLNHMLLYSLGDQDSVTGFIEFLGIAEPDQVVGDVLIVVLHSVIHTPHRQAK